MRAQILPLGTPGEPIWCSMCGAPLTPADNEYRDVGGWSCQCEGCREVLQARVRSIMKRDQSD